MRSIALCLGLLVCAPLSAHAENGAAAGETAPRAYIVDQDVSPDVLLFKKGNFTIGMGMLLQIQAAPYVGDQAAIQFNDPADSEGFRVRRARFGFGGYLFKDVSYYMAIDLKDTVVAAYGGDRGSEILDARIVWEPFRALRFGIGVDKVPFSSYIMESSGRLEYIEAPLSVTLLSPNRRLGLTVSGDIDLGPGMLRYSAGLYNGGEGFTSGNRLAGLAGGVRVEYDFFGPRQFVPDRPGLSVGGAYLYDDGPAVAFHRASAGVELYGWRTRFRAELLWERSTPSATPTAEPDAGAVTRRAVVGDLSVFLLRPYFQFFFRFEYFQDNDRLPTFGEQRLFTFGLNLYAYEHKLKFQAAYIRRDEVAGPVIANDVALIQIQGMF